MPKSESQPRRERAVGYLRVSTSRQAAHETSLEEQKRQIQAAGDVKDREVVRLFVDAGLTGRTDKRPQFRAMIQFACAPENAIRYVIVYNFSRYFRNVEEYLKYKRMLKAAGVRLVSASQDIPEGPAGELLETILAAFDAHSSEANAEAVRDIMLANAADGFWNGSKPPFGYKTIVALILRRKEKKKLEIEEAEVAIVHLIFKLYLQGADGAAPMGIKAIANYLNTHGYRHRGKLFYTAMVETILKRESYTGTHYHNKTDSRTRKPRPESEWVPISVPKVIEQETFDAVKRTLIARRPKNTPPRVVTGPTLLTGLAKCVCGGGMQLRTGKSGAYKYLTCANAALKGKQACPGQSVRMDKADEIVLKAVEERVFEPSRLVILLGKMFDRSEAGRDSLNTEIQRQRAVLNDATSRLRRIYDAIETGLTDIHDPLIKERVDGLKLQRSEVTRSIEELSKRRSMNAGRLDPNKVKAFSVAVRERLRDGNPAFRRAWLHRFVDRVDISPDKIRISGPKEPIVSMLSGAETVAAAMVPTFAREWRTRHDSNV
jgi:site-specific DNA recombinase